MSRKTLELAQAAIVHMCEHTKARKGYDNVLVGQALDAIKQELTPKLRSAVRVLVERELTKEPQTVAQLAKKLGVSTRLVGLYLQQIGAEPLCNEPEPAKRGSPGTVWAMPETGPKGE